MESNLPACLHVNSTDVQDACLHVSSTDVQEPRSSSVFAHAGSLHVNRILFLFIHIVVYMEKEGRCWWGSFFQLTRKCQGPNMPPFACKALQGAMTSPFLLVIYCSHLTANVSTWQETRFTNMICIIFLLALFSVWFFKISTIFKLNGIYLSQNLFV